MSHTEVNPIPEGHNSLSPYLIMQDANTAMDFYKQAFSATEILKFNTKDGRIGHAELKIGDSVIMLADEHPEMDAYAVAHYQGSPIKLHLYVTDVDAVFQQAVDAGAEVVRPVSDQFHGDRSGGLRDPEGYVWYLSSRIKNMTPQEMLNAMPS